MILENAWNVKLMNVRTNVKAISTLIVIILMIIAAIIGGIVSYAFTIAYYNKIPQKTSLTITNVYIDPENISSFIINVLNPSYSPADATISRIAISIKNETQLYDVVKTEPPIENGIHIPIGGSLNITCQEIKKDNESITLGELIGSFGFAGKTIIVHIFSPDSVAANAEAKTPYVKLNITIDFSSSVSVKKFNVTLTNDGSEVDVTVNNMLIQGEDAKMDPDVRKQPVLLSRGESAHFKFSINWSGTETSKKSLFKVYTEQGYIFRTWFEANRSYVTIKSVIFNEANPNQFNVTLFNSDRSPSYVNVTFIKCTIDNGPQRDFNCNLTGIDRNSTKTFQFDWSTLREHRGSNITIVAQFLQDFETTPFITTTPSPIIVKIENSVFNLRDSEHFNITLLNHASSIEAINITQIKVKETGQLLNGTTEVIPKLPYGPVVPGNYSVLQCTFNWTNFIETRHYNRTLTLTIDVVSNASLKKYSFDFSFILPIAELNMTVNFGSNETKYLNVTVTIKNLEYSLRNVTLSKVILIINTTAGLVEYEYVLPRNEIIIDKGSEAVFLFYFDRQKYSGNTLTVMVITEELGEVKSQSTWTVP